MKSFSLSSKFRAKILAEFRLPLLLYGFLFFCLSLLFSGYHFYKGNHAVQLTLVELLNDPTLYPDDPFAAVLPYYATHLWKLVAFCTSHFISLKSFLFISFLIGRLLVIFTAGYLANVLSSGSRMATLGCMAMFSLVPHSILGGGIIVSYFFEQTGLSTPFFLLAMASFYKNKHVSWAIWTAIGFNLNSLYGIYAISYFAAVFLLEKEYRLTWGKWLKGFIIFIALSSPTIYLTTSTYNFGVVNKELWLTACRIRFPHHFYPLTWSFSSYARFFALIFACIVVLYVNRKYMQKLFRHNLIWSSVAVFIWLLISFVVAYLLPIPSLIVSHSARGTDLMYCFAGISLIVGCSAIHERGKVSRIITTVMFLSAIFFWRIPPFYLVLIGLSIIIVPPLRNYLLLKGNVDRIIFLFIIIYLAMGISAVRDRIASDPDSAFVVQPRSYIRESAKWALMNTEKDTTFLVEPIWGWDEFRGLSKRPVFVTFKDACAMLWYRPFVEVWVERLKALGFDITTYPPDKSDFYHITEKFKVILKGLTDDHVKKLMKDYPIDYWIVYIKHETSFPVVYECGPVKIVKLH